MASRSSQADPHEDQDQDQGQGVGGVQRVAVGCGRFQELSFLVARPGLAPVAADGGKGDRDGGVGGSTTDGMACSPVRYPHRRVRERVRPSMTDISLGEGFCLAILSIFQSALPTPSPSTGVVGDETFGPDFWERFLTSAGFGGVMAVVAAVIAGSIALAQFRHVKRQHQDDRWWETLTWVYDRTMVEEGKKPPLPQRVTLSMLTALADKVGENRVDRLRGEAISSILTIFDATPQSLDRESESRIAAGGRGWTEGQEESEICVDGTGEPGRASDSSGSQTGSGSGGIESEKSEFIDEAVAGHVRVTDRRAVTMLQDLRDELDLKGFGPDASREARAYESRVKAALTVAAAELNAFVIALPAVDAGGGLIITQGHVGVVIVIKFSNSSVISSALLSRWTEEVRFDSDAGLTRYILVANAGLSQVAEVRLARFAARGGRFVAWSGAADTGHLKAVLAEQLRE